LGEVDADGFEIVSSKPSEKSLKRINESYVSKIKPIFTHKCLACHGTYESLPWYYQLPGAKHLMDHDMTEAKSKMNMSQGFPFEGHGSPADDLDALRRSIQKDNMPPLQYRLLHWGSKLTPDEIRIIDQWISESQEILRK